MKAKYEPRKAHLLFAHDYIKDSGIEAILGSYDLGIESTGKQVLAAMHEASQKDNKADLLIIGNVYDAFSQMSDAETRGLGMGPSIPGFEGENYTFRD